MYIIVTEVGLKNSFYMSDVNNLLESNGYEIALIGNNFRFLCIVNFLCFVW